MGEVQGQGYIAQALGVADVLAVAYFHAMRYRPDDPDWEGRDRFLLSIGHYAIALYAALIEAGIIPEDELETYGSDESRLPMSGMASYTPGMEMSGGSLGLGLGIAVGKCLGLKRKGSANYVYTLFSDGELDEGSTWEAVMSAAHYGLDNLIAVVDVNNHAGRRPLDQGDGFRAAGGEARGLRLVHPARRRQRHLRRPRRLRHAARAQTGRPSIIICRHADGQGRALPRSAREEPLHPGRARMSGQLALAALDEEAGMRRRNEARRPQIRPFRQACA
jgi:transketolase